MIGRVRHPHDDRLFDCYLAARHGEATDPRLAEHLADCAECAARYAQLAGLMEEVDAAADVDTDAVFTPERLRAQQHQIERRLEHVGRAARVIAFPHHGSAERRERPWHRLPRFAAAAAAAGLFIGVALGASFGGRWWLSPAERASTGVAPPSGSSMVPMADTNLAPDPAADDAFWVEFELMLDRPLTRELRPLDQLTPRVRDVASLR